MRNRYSPNDFCSRIKERAAGFRECRSCRCDIVDEKDVFSGDFERIPHPKRAENVFEPFFAILNFHLGFRRFLFCQNAGFERKQSRIKMTQFSREKLGLIIPAGFFSCIKHWNRYDDICRFGNARIDRKPCKFRVFPKRTTKRQILGKVLEKPFIDGFGEISRERGFSAKFEFMKRFFYRVVAVLPEGERVFGEGCRIRRHLRPARRTKGVPLFLAGETSKRKKNIEYEFFERPKRFGKRAKNAFGSFSRLCG